MSLTSQLENEIIHLKAKIKPGMGVKKYWSVKNTIDWLKKLVASDDPMAGLQVAYDCFCQHEAEAQWQLDHAVLDKYQRRRMIEEYREYNKKRRYVGVLMGVPLDDLGWDFARQSKFYKGGNGR